MEPAFQEDDKPVVCVDRDEAKAYCAYVKKRLPTEAEWEKAVAGPPKYTRSISPIFAGGLANFCDRQCVLPWRDAERDDGYTFTAPVDAYAANGYGLYNMHGNVWEWMADGYKGQFSSRAEATRKNPKNSAEHQGLRVVRGGSWYNNVTVLLRIAFRNRRRPDFRYYDVGFRCVASPR